MDKTLPPDLGLSLPLAQQAKQQLGLHIQAITKDKGMTQTQLAQLVGLDQPKVSKILRGQLDDFSVQRLSDVLDRLGKSVQLNIVEGLHIEPSIKTQLSDKVFSAGIAVLSDERTLSNPELTKLVFSLQQIQQFTAQIARELEQLDQQGQVLTSMEIIFTPTENGHGPNDIHEVGFKIGSMSKFSPFGRDVSDML